MFGFVFLLILLTATQLKYSIIHVSQITAKIFIRIKLLPSLVRITICFLCNRIFESVTVANLIYLTDLVVDNLLQCFTFPPTKYTVSFETHSPIDFSPSVEHC